MRFQDYIIDSTQKSFDAAFKTAAAIPADKLGWSPLDNGRTALDQAQELAQCPAFVTGMVNGEQGEPSESDWEKIKAERLSWDTIEKCQAVAAERLKSLFEAIGNAPDSRLTETVWLPYDGGRDFTIQEVMEYPRWNADYHAGQMNYIQTLYGDNEMH